MDAHRTFVGVLRAFIGAHRTFVGANITFAGAPRAFVGVNRTFVGVHRTFVGANKTFASHIICLFQLIFNNLKNLSIVAHLNLREIDTIGKARFLLKIVYAFNRVLS